MNTPGKNVPEAKKAPMSGSNRPRALDALEDECREAAAALAARLTSSDIKITFAESCTAGLLAGTFCSVSGASAVFEGSIVSYANRVKAEFLGVPEEVLQTVGAVSEECARAMALGALSRFRADIALSVTGIAGPTGGTPRKPVGTVFIGCAHGDKTAVRRFLFRGDRRQVRLQSVLWALKIALETLEEPS